MRSLYQVANYDIGVVSYYLNDISNMVCCTVWMSRESWIIWCAMWKLSSRELWFIC